MTKKLLTALLCGALCLGNCALATEEIIATEEPAIATPPVTTETPAVTAPSTATEAPAPTAAPSTPRPLPTVAPTATVPPATAEPSAAPASPAATATPAATVVVAVSEEPTATPKPEKNVVGMPLVPDFSLPNQAGESVQLSSFLGKQVILYFWASWCGPCQAGMADKQELYERIEAEDLPIEIMAVNLTDGQRETRQTANAYLAERQLTFPVYYEEDGLVSWVYNVQSIPVVFLIDEEGYLKDGALGAISRERLFEMVGVAP